MAPAAEGLRLQAAREWVAANRPADWPYAEYEAYSLAGFAASVDGERPTVADLLERLHAGDLMDQAIDADRDGRVSDDELASFAVFASELDYRQHPYMVALLDTNRDGMLSSEEEARASQLRANAAGFHEMTERTKLRTWDTDGDGRLSEVESAEGMEGLFSRIELHPDGTIEWLTQPGAQTQADHEAALAAMEKEQGQYRADTRRAQRDDLLDQMLARPYIEAMTVQPLGGVMPESIERLPAQPDPAAYGADGAMNQEQLAAFMRAMETWETAVGDRRALQAAYIALATFERAAAEGDTDGDGRLSPEEWELRAATQAETRAKRLLGLEYDLDGSGKIEGGELVTYLEWYRDGSLRADVNYDGRLDAIDLEAMARNFQGQGG